MNETITNYLQSQDCASVCCMDDENHPYCFNCFYVYNPDEQLLYYKSALNTHHSELLQKHTAVAGTVLPSRLHKLQVKGLQFEGALLPFAHVLAAHASEKYHKAQPLAIAVPGEIWTIRIDHIKYTDSTLGFGKKLNWERCPA